MTSIPVSEVTGFYSAFTNDTHIANWFPNNVQYGSSTPWNGTVTNTSDLAEVRENQNYNRFWSSTTEVFETSQPLKLYNHGGENLFWSNRPWRPHPRILSQISPIPFQLPSMTMRTRTNIEQAAPAMFWKRQRLSKNLFQDRATQYDVLTIQSLQTGIPILRHEKRTISQLLCGNSIILGKHQVVRWTKNTEATLVIPHVITGRDYSDWTASARAFVKSVLEKIHADCLADIVDLNTLDASIRRSVSVASATQAWNAIYVSEDHRPPPDTIPGLVNPLAADNFINLQKVDNACFTAEGLQIFRIQKRKIAARLKKEKAELALAQLEQAAEAENLVIENLLNNMKAYQKRLQATKARLAQQESMLPQALENQIKAKTVYQSLTEASIGLHEQLVASTEALEADGTQLIEYLEAWGIRITHLVFNDGRGDVIEPSKISISDLLQEEHSIASLRFITIEPKPMSVVNNLGNKVDEDRICGPFECSITFDPDLDIPLTFQYRMYDPNGVIGYKWWSHNEYPYAKIHPHHGVREVCQASNIIGRWIENPCLGELAPSLLSAMKNGKIRLATTGCLTYLYAAAAQDEWGQTYNWFPYAENYSYDFNADIHQAFVDQLDAATIIKSDCAIHARNMRFASNSDLQWALLQVAAGHNFDKHVFSRWIPMHGRTHEQVITSILLEANLDTDLGTWSTIQPEPSSHPSQEETSV